MIVNLAYWGQIQGSIVIGWTQGHLSLEKYQEDVNASVCMFWGGGIGEVWGAPSLNPLVIQL